MMATGELRFWFFVRTTADQYETSAFGCSERLQVLDRPTLIQLNHPKIGVRDVLICVVGFR